MIKTTLKIDGMMCSMCEAHINDVIRKTVPGALSRLLSGKTVLVIAHRMRTVEAADKIVVLSDGRVIEEGRPAELLAKEESTFRRMTRLQAASAGWSL
jgi:ATP-binding cassette subfamily B protein